MLFYYKNKVFVTHSLTFSMDKSEREIPYRSRSFLLKKLTKVKLETPKVGNAAFFSELFVATSSTRVQRTYPEAFLESSQIHMIEIYFQEQLKSSNIFKKRLHHRCLTGFKRPLWCPVSIQFAGAFWSTKKKKTTVVDYDFIKALRIHNERTKKNSARPDEKIFFQLLALSEVSFFCLDERALSLDNF